MPLTDWEKTIYALARERISTGRLPNTPPATLAAGSGSGEKCSLCEGIIKPEDIEYEFSGPAGVQFRFHFRCHTIWQLVAAAAGSGSQHRSLQS
jgi:hypothetical protein